MPKKNPERDDQNTYVVHFTDGTSEKFHTKDKLIAKLAKADAGGYHPLASAGDEWLINLDNVLYIEHPAAIEPLPATEEKK